MKLYDVLLEGYHTPLNAIQIAKLYGAGRLQRNDRCKEVGKRAWQTIDDLFPLLKYDSSAGLPVGNSSAAIPCDKENVSRRALWVGAFVTLLALSTFLIGSSYFPASGEPVRPRARAQSPIAQSAPSLATNVPSTNSNIVYADEQGYRTAQLRQEERARQLDQTRLAEQRITQDRLRAQQQQTQSNSSASQEFSVPLGTYTELNIGGSHYRLAVHDDGPDEIRVIVDYARPVRFQKHGGFEERDLETLILSNGRAHLYYVNTIPDHIGHCTLRLRDE